MSATNAKLPETVVWLGDQVKKLANEPVELSNQVLPGCGRYEFTEGKSDKFYAVLPEYAGDPYGNYRVYWGRNGTDGQSQVISREEASRRIRDKVSKGYNLVVPIDRLMAAARVDKKRGDRKAAEQERVTNFIEELFKIS